MQGGTVVSFPKYFQIPGIKGKGVTEGIYFNTMRLSLRKSGKRQKPYVKKTKFHLGLRRRQPNTYTLFPTYSFVDNVGERCTVIILD